MKKIFYVLLCSSMLLASSAQAFFFGCSWSRGCYEPCKRRCYECEVIKYQPCQSCDVYEEEVIYE